MLEVKQQNAYKTLMNGLTKNRISHAYLFEGEKGTPKLEMAMEFVKKLFAIDQEEQKEQIARRIDHQNYPNLVIIEPEGLSIKKEQIQNLQREFSKSTIEGSKKVYIIKEAEKMTTSAANSLLKFLEEPVSDIHAILLTDNIHQILKTIVSRCQIISFTPLNLNDFISSYDSKYKTTNLKLATILSLNHAEIDGLLNDENFNNEIVGVVTFVNKFEQMGVDTIAFLKELWTTYFNDKMSTLKGLEMLFYFYNDIITYKYLLKVEIYDDYLEDIKKYTSQEEFTLLYKVEAILSAIKKANSNMNTTLLMEQLIIEMKGGLK